MTRSLRVALLCPAIVSSLSLLACAQGSADAGLPAASMSQVCCSSTLPAAVLKDEQSPTLPPDPRADSSSTQDNQPAPQQAEAEKRSQTSKDQLKAEEKQRLLGIMPAFNTVDSDQAVPLRPSQKVDLWYHSAIDPFTIGVAAIDGGIEQSEDTYPEYHQGVEGFAKRFGAAYADSVDGNFWGNAVLPIILHQDPRYFRRGYGSVKSRLWYAAISTVRAKGDNGKWQPNYSNVGGNLIGGAISNFYYPAADRGVSLIFERGFTVTAEGAFGALAFEFYPDAIGYLKRRHERKLARSTGAAGVANPGSMPSR